MAVALTWLRLEPVSGRRTALRGRGGPRASRNRGHGWPRPGAGAWMVTSGAIALALSLVSGCSGVARRKPFVSDSLHGWNVLLVTIDTLRADHVGAYGNQLGLTPTLDRLAREGLRFTHAYAHVPLTLPSHTTIMTGAYPMTNGVRDNGSFRLDGSRPTLARALKTAGYRTGAFVGAFVLDARFGLNSGFDVYDDRMIGTGGRSLEVVQRPAEQVLAPAEHWILGEPSALSPKPSVRPSALNPQPFFAWVHLYDPHEPYTPPEPFRSRYSGNPYAGEIAYTDASLGAFLDRLRNAGALNHTFIVVASDHGESLGEHGERTHGLFAYDSTLRVPLDPVGPSHAGARRFRFTGKARGRDANDSGSRGCPRADGSGRETSPNGDHRRSGRRPFFLLFRSAQCEPDAQLGAAQRRHRGSAETRRPPDPGALRSGSRSRRDHEHLRGSNRACSLARIGSRQLHPCSDACHASRRRCRRSGSTAVARLRRRVHGQARSQLQAR